MANSKKVKAGGKKQIKDLSVKDAKTVVGGRKAGGSQQEYLIIKLNDVLVSAYSLGSDEGESEPHDAFSLNFVKLSYDYKPQKADGSLDAPVHAGWDLTKNVKV